MSFFNSLFGSNKSNAPVGQSSWDVYQSQNNAYNQNSLSGMNMYNVQNQLMNNAQSQYYSNNINTEIILKNQKLKDMAPTVYDLENEAVKIAWEQFLVVKALSKE
jgi:hypothetical protein